MYLPVAKRAHGPSFYIDYTPGALVSAGTVVIVNGRVGIADADIPANTLGSIAIAPTAFDFISDGLAITDAQDVYFNTTNKQSTPIQTGNVYLGKAEGGFAASTAGTTYTRVVLVDPVSNGSIFSNQIADPGASGAVPVTNSGFVLIVTAGAETRTMAAPTSVGQNMLLIAKTAVGTATFTVTGGINSTGNTHIAMAAAGVSIQLISVASGAGFRWAVVYNDGCTLS